MCLLLFCCPTTTTPTTNYTLNRIVKLNSYAIRTLWIIFWLMIWYITGWEIQYCNFLFRFFLGFSSLFLDWLIHKLLPRTALFCNSFTCFVAGDPTREHLSPFSLLLLAKSLFRIISISFRNGGCLLVKPAGLSINQLMRAHYYTTEFATGHPVNNHKLYYFSARHLVSHFWWFSYPHNNGRSVLCPGTHVSHDSTFVLFYDYWSFTSRTYVCN